MRYSVWRYTGYAANGSANRIRHAKGLVRSAVTTELNEVDDEAKTQGTIDLGADSEETIEADKLARKKWLSGRRGVRPKNYAEFIFAGPPPYGEDDEWSEKKERKWADTAMAWFRKRFPHSVIVAASLHRDETSPHIHVVFSPQSRDAQDKPRWGWCFARNDAAAASRAELKGHAVKKPTKRQTKLGAKVALRLLQDDMHLHVGAPFNLERGERGSKRKHEETDKSKTVGAKLKKLEKKLRAELAVKEREVLEDKKVVEVQAKRVAASGRAVQRQIAAHGELAEQRAELTALTAEQEKVAEQLEKTEEAIGEYEAQVNAQIEQEKAKIAAAYGEIDDAKKRQVRKRVKTRKGESRLRLAMHIFGRCRRAHLTDDELFLDEWQEDIDATLDWETQPAAVQAIADKHHWDAPAPKTEIPEKERGQVVPFRRKDKDGRGDRRS